MCFWLVNANLTLKDIQRNLIWDCEKYKRAVGFYVKDEIIMNGEIRIKVQNSNHYKKKLKKRLENVAKNNS